MNAVARGKRDMFEAFVNKELGEGNPCCRHYARKTKMCYIELEKLLKGFIPDVHNDDKMPSDNNNPKQPKEKKSFRKSVPAILPDADPLPLPSDPDTTIPPLDQDGSILPSDPDASMVPSDLDTSIFPSDPDTSMRQSDPDISQLSLNGDDEGLSDSSNKLDGKSFVLLVNPKLIYIYFLRREYGFRRLQGRKSPWTKKKEITQDRHRR